MMSAIPDPRSALGPSYTPPNPASGLRWPREPALGGWYTEEEIEAATAAVEESTDWRVGFRSKSREILFEDAFAAYTGTQYAIAYNGAGTALDMVVRCLDLEPGDEVISCAINFVGTHLAVIGTGGRLVLCEHDPATLNICPADAEGVLSPRTRAILVTHMNGLPADMDALLNLAARHPHPVHGPPRVIVDAARACGARTIHGPVGSQGWATVFSFQSKKLMTTLGEGGMVTTDDRALAVRLRRLRSFGKGHHWGTNLKMTKAQAAVGLVQLRRLDEMNDRRIELALQRTDLLQQVTDLVLPPKLTNRLHVYYRYNILTPSTWGSTGRDALMRLLEDNYGLGSTVADPPTYLTHQLIREHTAGRRWPLAEQTAARLLCPCLHPLITDRDNTQICEAIAAGMDKTRQLLRLP
jgi:dTDP-4-amino-4,6-dideoxygalactose transaminase